MRPIGTTEQLEHRRRKGIALLQQGHRVNETARLVGITPGAITQWQKAYDKQGEKFFQAHSPPGRPPGLSEKQKNKLEKLLLEGASKNGFPTELWTLQRVAEVMKKHFGVGYDASSVWHILQGMGWSCQKPEKCARERDEQAIAVWRKQDFQRMKKSPKKQECPKKVLMEKQQDNRRRAIDDLIENVKAQDFIPDEGNPAYALTNGKQVHMPAYVPYVGPEYFQYHPRILCYAINQNLSKHRSWSDTWMREWSVDQMCAIDRLNHAVECGRALPIKPYAEGFIPLTAILCILAYIRCSSADLPSTIDAVVSVTNFVKFSTSDNASSSEIPDSWWRESGSRYVRHEIDILQPDLIVTFGKRTFAELARVFSDTNYKGDKPQIRECRFPGRIPSEKARPVRGNDKVYWTQDILPLTSRIKSPLESFATWRMTRFPGYFLDVAKALNLL